MQKQRLYTGILFTVTVLFWFSQYAYTSYVNPELLKMGATASFMGFVGGAYGFTQLVLRIPVGITADKWQMKFFVCAGCLCVGLASLTMLLFFTPAAFLAGRALGGVAASAWVPFTVLYSSYFKPEHATKSITMIFLGNQLGRMLSFLAAGIIVASFGPKSAFMISSAAGFLAFVISLFIYEDKSGPARAPLTLKQLAAVAGNRNLLVTTALCIFLQIVTFATVFAFTANHAVAIGATPAQLSFMNVVLFIPSVILSFAVSKYILNYIEPKWLVILGFVLTAVYCAVMTFTATVGQLYLVQVVGSASTVMLGVMTGLCVRDIPQANRGAAMGFYQAMYGLGMTVGPIIMGFLVQLISLRAGFLVMAGVALSSSAAAFLLYRTTKKEGGSNAS
ncbi:MAG: MFS transporter [Oscillospiraceae bacterium]|nr:MFS transporter [Oscillospiraceae bacterium]